MSRVKTNITFAGQKLGSTDALATAIKNRIQEAARAAQVAAAERIAHEIWENTPVVTGNTKSNWSVVSAGVAPAWDSEAVGHQPFKMSISATSGPLRIVNPAPAAYFIEVRSGFVRTAMMDYKGLVNDAVRDLKGKK